MEILALLSLFFVGFSYGASVCTFTCMPFLAPLLINARQDRAGVMRVLVPFSLGRMSAYIVIALVATMGAGVVKSMIDDSDISRYILSLSTLIMGLVVLYKSYKNTQTCCTKSESRLGHYAVGFGISFNLCVPVMSLVAVSANSDSLMSSAIYGIIFGLGVVSFGFILFLFVFSKIINTFMEELGKMKKKIEIFSGFFLILLSILVYMEWISL
jgi:cytochrome c biogenesis protein CcdA